ncbi:MAG: hypothetical protein Kow0029_22890 [Candidatus Rifleibacteriota bacterium]
MNRSARKTLLILAAFLILIGNGFTAGTYEDVTERDTPEEKRSVCLHTSQDMAFFNPLAIPELKSPVSAPHLPGNDQVVTAVDPRFDSISNPHRVPFVPASEQRPPPPCESIPIIDTRPEHHYDMNEWEEDRLFSSNLYTDTSFYATRIDGDKTLSSRDEGEFYEENIRYELFSSRNDGDSLAVNLDTTYTNDRRPYRNGFTLNQVTIDSRSQRSRLVLGHAFPEMSEMSMTQNMLGIYGVQDYEYTRLSGFGGYYATEKDDLKNPRYVGGLRIEHSRDESISLGLNLVGTEDERDNAGSNNMIPAMANRLVSMDIRLRPTENIYLDAEIAQSDTDFDKQDNQGDQKGDAYIIKAGYERENAKIEAGIESAETAFLSPLGQSPRDERAYFARFYYELNQYISARFSQRQSRDNLDNYQRSTIVRDQPELQLTIKPSEYYKDLRVDFFYQPLHEYSDNSGFMNRFVDLMWFELNHKAGEMRYYAGLSQTIDKDDVNILNDRDIQKFDFRLTWEYDSFRKVYSSYSLEKLSYKRAGGSDQTEMIGFGGSSKFHDDIYIDLDYLRESVDPTAVGLDSEHDRINFSITREYSPSSRLILDLEGNRSRFNSVNRNYDDYTAKLRYLKAF